jgi:predicted enzyme related to lactoylglutathione lyase
MTENALFLLPALRRARDVFETADCQKTFEELSAKGVTFLQEPAERPYGIEALCRDDSGNWFSLTQPKWLG